MGTDDETPKYLLNGWIRRLSTDPLLGVLVLETGEDVIEVAVSIDGATRLVQILQRFVSDHDTTA